jgi:ABC-type branched-subunit amino acid transport system substrate-binding protein
MKLMKIFSPYYLLAITPLLLVACAGDDVKQVDEQSLLSPPALEGDVVKNNNGDTILPDLPNVSLPDEGNITGVMGDEKTLEEHNRSLNAEHNALRKSLLASLKKASNGMNRPLDAENMQILENFSFGDDAALNAPSPPASNDAVTRIEGEGVTAEINGLDVLGQPSFTSVAMLIPLSGAQGKLGESLWNAAQMALFDSQESYLNLIPIDTKGSDEGAIMAAEKAIRNGVDIIIGPLNASASRAIAPLVNNANITVISLSNDSDIASDNIFPMGFDPHAQLYALFHYAKQQGKNNIVIFAPDNDYGKLVVNYANSYANDTSNIRITGHILYNVDSTDFNPYIAELLTKDIYNKLSAAVNLEKTGDSDGVTAKEKLPFNSVLIAALHSKNLRTIAAQLDYLNIAPPDTQLMGLQTWESFSNLHQEPSLQRAWFVSNFTPHLTAFTKRFRENFNKNPFRITSIAYDAVATLNALKAGGYDLSQSTLTTDRGFTGVDGIFRFLKTGYVQRAYSIRQITAGGYITLQDAPQKF